MANSGDLVARVLTLRNQVNEVVCFNDAQSADKAYALDTLDQVIVAISPTSDEDIVGDYIPGDITHINGLAS